MRLPLKRARKAARAALLALSFLATSNANAANDWVNFATVSMTNPTTPKLTAGYGCRTDGKDILCDSAASAVSFGTGGLIDYGGMTVVGSVSASAVSSTYVSATVLQINPSNMSCSAGLNGTIRYSATSNTLEVCTGSAWTTLSSNTAAVSAAGVSGSIQFNDGAGNLAGRSDIIVSDSGRVGIGTNDPQQKLHVNNGGSNWSTVEISNGASNLNLGVAPSGAALITQGGNYPLQFATSSTERVRIDENGHVGVGTVAPTATLQVSGTFTVSNSGQSTNPSLFADTAGNVIIGSTTTPWGKLHVGGSVSLRDYAGGDARLFSYSGDGSIVTELFAFNGLGGYAGTYTNNPFFIRTGDINRMAFTSSGSIGIGTANPGSSLTIVGEVQPGSSGGACVSATNGGAIRYSGGTLYYCNGSNTWASITAGGAGFTGGGSATAIAFWNGTNSLTYESATTSGLYWDHTNGRLGIGTNSPSSELHVSGTGVIRVAGSNARMTFEPYGYDTTNLWNIDNKSGSLRLFTEDYSGANGLLMMTITSASNVGIGTNISPGSSLTVVGTVQSKALLTDAGAGLSAANVANFVAMAPGSQQGQKVGVALFPTFMGTADNLPRRAADIVAGFNGGAWGNQYLSLNVGGNGPTANDVASITIERVRITNAGNVGIATQSPTATLQVSGSMIVSTTGQNTASAASMLVDSRGVSVSSIVHITGSAFSPIGAGGNAILSGTTAVSTSSAGSITFVAGGSRVGGFNAFGPTFDANGLVLAGDGGYLGLGAYYTAGNWVNSTTGQGGGAIRNSSGVMTFSTDASPGTAGTAFSSFTEKMRLQSNGYLALGTQSASAHFHIAGDTNNGVSWPKAAIILEDTGTNGRTFSIASRGSGGFGIADETSHLVRLTIGSNGVATFFGVSNCTIASGTGTTSCTSDRRLKDRIQPIEDPLDKLMLIKGVTYHWKRKDISGPQHIGVIAQDVEKAFPQAVSEVSDTTIGTAKTVDYAVLVAPIIEVIKQFKHRFESTDAKLKAANDNIQTLSNEVEELRQEVRQLKQQRQ